MSACDHKKKILYHGCFLSAAPRVPPLGVWEVTSSLLSPSDQLNTFHPLSKTLLSSKTVTPHPREGTAPSLPPPPRRSLQELVKLIDPRDMQQDWMESDHARLLHGLLRKCGVLVLEDVSTFASSPLPPVPRRSPRASTHEDWNQMCRVMVLRLHEQGCWGGMLVSTPSTPQEQAHWTLHPKTSNDCSLLGKWGCY